MGEVMKRIAKFLAVGIGLGFLFLVLRLLQMRLIPTGINDGWQACNLRRPLCMLNWKPRFTA